MDVTFETFGDAYARAHERYPTWNGLSLFVLATPSDTSALREYIANFDEIHHSSLLESILAIGREALRALEIRLIETLADPEPDATSAENNSSVILLLKLGEDHFLFTADAGVPALTEAANRAEALGIDLRTVKYVQVPHHGSKRNIGPTVLNRIVGPIKPQETYNKTAFISATKNGNPKHPAKKVVNAFKRRGANVFATQGQALSQRSNDAPKRDSWNNAVPLPLYEDVDD